MQKENKKRGSCKVQEIFEKLHKDSTPNKLDNLSDKMKIDYRAWLIKKFERTLKNVEKQQNEYNGQ